jgi:hypothetical protein
MQMRATTTTVSEGHKTNIRALVPYSYVKLTHLELGLGGIPEILLFTRICILIPIVLF